MSAAKGQRGIGRRTAALLLLACAVVPGAGVHLFAPDPVDRHIHVKSFRYGKDPHIIRANRGDRLHLTFEATHTGHSFFLEEWDLDAKIRP